MPAYVSHIIWIFLLALGFSKSPELQAQSDSSSELRLALATQLELVKEQRGANILQSLVHADSALYLAKKLSEDSLLSKAHRYRSYALRGLGRWSEAREDLNKGFRLNTDKHSASRINYFNNLANIYTHQAWYERAIYYYSEALKLAHEHDRPLEVTGMSINLGVLYLDWEKPLKSFPYLYRAAHYLPSSKPEMETYVLYNLAEAHRATGGLDSALYYTQLLRQKHKSAELPLPLSTRLLIVRAKVYHAQGKAWEEVAASGEEAWRLAKATKSPLIQFKIGLRWVEILFECGRKAEATEVLAELDDIEGLELNQSDSIGWYEIKVLADSSNADWAKAVEHQELLLNLQAQMYEKESEQYRTAIRADYSDEASAMAAQQREGLLALKEDLVTEQRINFYLIVALLLLLLLLGPVLIRTLRSRSRVNEKLREKAAQQTKAIAGRNEKLRQYAYLNAHKLSLPLHTMLRLLDELERPDADVQPLHALLREAGMDMDKVIREINTQLHIEDSSPTTRSEL